MPGFDRDQVAIDNTVENRRLGSILLTVGWVLLWMDGVLFAFFFESLRAGSSFWPIWLGIEGVLGLVLVIMGNRYRHAIGATKWGRRDLQYTLAQQRQDESEDRRVA